MSRCPVLFLAVLMAFAISALPSYGVAASPASGQVVNEIRVVGNQKVETEAILDNISIRAGDILRSEAVGQAIRDIYRLKYFRHVRVEYEEADAGGVIITILTTEKPAVREVVIAGNKKVTTDDIKEVMTIITTNITI